jgi:hypothetical protein
MLGLMIFVPVIYIAIAWMIIKRLTNKRAKWIAVVIFILIPTWDEIAGRIYFQYLCETEGGSKIYKIVELSKEYFSQQGRPDLKFSKKQGAFLEIADRYVTSRSGQTVSKTFRIDKTIITVKDTVTGTELATNTSFVYFGGWLINNTGAQLRATRCPQGTDEYYNQFYSSIFKLVKAKN